MNKRNAQISNTLKNASPANFVTRFGENLRIRLYNDDVGYT